MSRDIVKIIKGKPIYLYKRSQYLEQPINTFIGMMYYDSNENTTYIKCIKKSKKMEVLCSAIILACVIVSLFVPTGGKEMIHYTQIVDYYDGGYYVNVSNSVGSSYPVLCVLMYGDVEVGRSLINPGEDWVKVNGEYYDRDMKLFIEYQYPILKRYDLLNISVVNRNK